MKHQDAHTPDHPGSLALSNTFSIVLMNVCIAAFIVLCAFFREKAESFGALLFFMVFLFPSLPVIAVTELVHRLAGTALKKQQAEFVGLLIAAASSLLTAAFWLFMVLQGGNKLVPMAGATIGVNAAATLLLFLKRTILRASD